jgi:AcrR family transcriptional regulator
MDARLERSRDAIIRAITPMIEEMPLAGISITRVVSEAGVTRPTFYQQFPDILAAARVAAFHRLETAFPFPEPLPEGRRLTSAAVKERIIRQSEPIFAHLAAHRAFYVRVMDEAGTAGFFDDLLRFTAARLLPEAMAVFGASEGQVEFTTKFFAGGLTWLAIDWLRSGPDMPPGTISANIAALVAGLLRDPVEPGSE